MTASNGVQSLEPSDPGKGAMSRWATAVRLEESKLGADDSSGKPSRLRYRVAPGTVERINMDTSSDNGTGSGNSLDTEILLDAYNASYVHSDFDLDEDVRTDIVRAC